MGDTITEEDLKCFFSSTLGSRWFSWTGSRCGMNNCDCAHWEHVTDSDQIWIGEVSWLKAAITEDVDSYVPEPVQAVNELIGESLPVLDEDLKKKIIDACIAPRQSQGASWYQSTDKVEALAKWLDEHMGQKLFTVSW
jgi:hypothetical protein